MRLVVAVLMLVCSIGCNPDSRHGGADARRPADAPADDPPQPADACVGLECQVVPCEAQGRGTTSVSGTVYAPNGTLPLYGVTVYVPSSEPGPLPEDVQCTRCNDELPGKAVTKTITDELGRFTLQRVPSGTDIPLVVTIGKWRRRLVLPTVTECTDNPVEPTLTRLPKNKTEGDLPKIAMVTGGCDALECLIRKLGIDDSEFTSDTGTGRIHLYYATGGANRLASGVTLNPASLLWGNLPKLKQYDIGLFSCECSEYPDQKPQPMMNNIKAYADAGGRLFLSHYHNVWITGENATHAPPVWPTIATCSVNTTTAGNDFIDTVNNPKGTSFSLWMEYVMGSSIPGVIPIQEGKQTCSSIDNSKAERWIYFKNGTQEFPQNFQFTTPNEMPSNARCGKVVFSDMHVASGSDSGSQFPTGCSTSAMTPQEKALAFMFFNIASCVGIIQ
jgi:hypothetical protein